MSEDEIQIRLPTDIARVLQELVWRIEDQRLLKFEHPAEQVALWQLEAGLERAPSNAFFDPDYVEVLRTSRESVIDRYGMPVDPE